MASVGFLLFVLQVQQRSPMMHGFGESFRLGSLPQTWGSRCKRDSRDQTRPLHGFGHPSQEETGVLLFRLQKRDINCQRNNVKIVVR